MSGSDVAPGFTIWELLNFKKDAAPDRAGKAAYCKGPVIAVALACALTVFVVRSIRYRFWTFPLLASKKRYFEAESSLETAAAGIPSDPMFPGSTLADMLRGAGVTSNNAEPDEEKAKMRLFPAIKTSSSRVALLVKVEGQKETP